MGIFADRYEYLTQKQANIVYAAYKRGDIELSGEFVREMYDCVEDRSNETYEMMCRVQLLISLIMDNELELAQYVADGGWTGKMPVEVGRRPAEEEDCWFDDEEEIERKMSEGIPVYEERWMCVDNHK